MAVKFLTGCFLVLLMTDIAGAQSITSQFGVKKCIVTVRGTISLSRIDGGGRAIVDSLGTRYDVVGAKMENFWIEGLRVKAKLRITTGLGGAPGAGIFSEVLKIEKLSGAQPLTRTVTGAVQEVSYMSAKVWIVFADGKSYYDAMLPPKFRVERLGVIATVQPLDTLESPDKLIPARILKIRKIE